MAISLLDGTVSAFNFTIAASTSAQWPCVSNYMSCDLVREFFEQTTFCSSGWRSRTPGLKQLIGRIDGYANKGFAYSDPSVLFATTAGFAFVATFDTGCTFTGTLQAARFHVGLHAGAQSEMGLDFESTGAVTVAWVTS